MNDAFEFGRTLARIYNTRARYETMKYNRGIYICIQTRMCNIFRQRIYIHINTFGRTRLLSITTPWRTHIGANVQFVNDRRGSVTFWPPRPSRIFGTLERAPSPHSPPFFTQPPPPPPRVFAISLSSFPRESSVARRRGVYTPCTRQRDFN